jgi:hypothetical protein
MQLLVTCKLFVAAVRYISCKLFMQVLVSYLWLLCDLFLVVTDFGVFLSYR